MKLYKSIGPNPRVVTVFMAEKGIALPSQDLDLMGGENRREPYLSINPAGQSPALELDDGSLLTEIGAICEYLEELHPEPALIGATAEERAKTRMWVGRVNLKVCEPLANGFRFAEGLPLFQNRMRCLPEAASGLKAVAADGLAWIDQHMGEPFLAGDRFTVADILLFAFLDFGRQVGQPFSPDLARIGPWFERVKARASVAAG